MNPWADHNPWGRDESAGPRPFDFMDSSPGYSQRTYRSPDGRFTFSSTTIGRGYPRQSTSSAAQTPILPMMLESLNTIFRGLSETYDPHNPHGSRSPGFDNPFMAHSSSPPDHDPAGPDAHAGHEGLFPRDTDRAQPMTPPVGSLAEYDLPLPIFYL